MMEEERYVLTPKGMARFCLSDVGIEFSDSQLDAFWILFEHRMRQSGYVTEGE